MKIFITYSILMVLLAIFSLQRAVAATTEVWLLDPSSLGAGFTNTVARAAKYAYQTNTPAGTRFIIAASTPGGFATLTDFTIDYFKYDSIITRKLHYEPQFKKAKGWYATEPSADNYGIVLKSVFEYLSNDGVTSNICLHLCGSPCARFTRPALDLAAEYPGDGTIWSDARESPLGMLHLQDRFFNCPIVWYTTDKAELPEESARKLFRYESLAAAWAGARIVSYTADFDSTINASRDTNRRAQETFAPSDEPPVIHHYFIHELSRAGLPPALSATLESLHASGVTRALAAGWQSDSDVDIWMASRSFPSEQEVCFQRPTNPHLKLLGDKTQATGDDYEIVIIDPQVALDSLQIYLNLYRSNASASGFVFLLNGDDIYKLPFTFPTSSRGNRAQGHDQRTQSPDWILIDTQQLLAHPITD